MTTVYKRIVDTIVKMEEDSAGRHTLVVEQGGASGSLTKTSSTGSGAIAVSVAVTADTRLVSASIHFSSAPTTSENLTVKLNAATGAAYDTLLLKRNPSTNSETDLIFIPDEAFYLVSGDAIDVDFANTDQRVYGVQVVMESV